MLAEFSNELFFSWLSSERGLEQAASAICPSDIEVKQRERVTVPWECDAHKHNLDVAFIKADGSPGESRRKIYYIYM